MHRFTTALVTGATTILASSATAETHTIPFDLSTGWMVVPVEINGEGPFNFAIDTGAPITLLSSEVQERLGLEAVATQPVGDPSGNNAQQADVLRLDSIQVGDFALTNQRALGMDLSNVFNRDGAPDGILTFRMFKDFLLTFDLPGSELRIDSESSLNPADEGVHRYRSRFGSYITLNVDVAGSRYRALLDTGARRNISMGLDTVASLPLKSEPVFEKTAHTVNNSYDTYTADLNGTVTIAGVTIEDPTIQFDDMHNGGKPINIGLRLLSEYVVTIDQRNRLLQIAPPAEP